MALPACFVARVESGDGDTIVVATERESPPVPLPPVVSQPIPSYPPQTAEPDGTYRLVPGRLHAGDYRTDVFRPPFRFRLGEGWHSSEPIDGGDPPVELPDFIEIARPGLVLTIARPEGIARVVDGAVVTEPLPDDLVAYLQDFEGWDVVAPTRLTVAGYEAQQFNGTVTSQVGSEAICGRPCSVFFALSNGAHFLVFSGDRVRVTVVDVDGVDVVFVVDIAAGTGTFEGGLQTAEQVLRTVEFIAR